MSENGDRGMNILIFEGGLAGGLSSLILFRELMNRALAAGGDARAYKQYQVIAGTGTGALNACMLGLLQIDVEQAISTYARLVEHVFSDKKMISTSGSGTFKASKMEEELKKIVRDVTGDEDTRMMSTSLDGEDCKIMVFAMLEHNMNASTPRIFRSYHVSNNQTPNCPIWQALRATTAHPELFKSIDIRDTSGIGESLVGGDMGCSNPTPHVLAEVGALYPDRHIASIVCIGSGHARTIHIPRPNPLHRIMPINVLTAMKNIATDNERVAQEMAMRFQETAGVYFRFSVDQGMQDVRTSQWQRTNEVVAHTRAYMQRVEVGGKLNEAAQSVVAQRRALSTVLVGGKVQQPPQQLTTGVKRCPAPSPLFTGCEHHVSQISGCLSSAAERRVCVVHGLGGAGKTQIALKVVERTKNDWADIVYVDATSRETTIGTLKGFAVTKKIGDTHEDAIRWLELSPQPWLLVFDNADDPDLNLPEFLPEGSHGCVLITTRLRSLALLGQGPGSDCNVGGMDGEEAVELLLKKARMQDQVLSVEEVEAANKLAEDLGYLALAIVHAGAYIWCSSISIAKYRKQCLEHTRVALEKYGRMPGNVEKYDKTVYTTWLMSYERLKPRTQQLLVLMAYLHHDGITEDIFKRAAGNTRRPLVIPPSNDETATRDYVRDYLELFLDADGHWDSNVFSTLVDELLLYSLIDYDRVNEAYTLHVLVQDWASTTAHHPKLVALKHTLHLVALSVDESRDVSARTFRRGLSLHVSRLLNKPSAVNVNDATYFAMVYDENGRWNEAEALQAQVFDATKQALGEDHLDTLKSANSLAWTYWNQGRWDEAEALQVQTLTVTKQTLGEHHPQTLATMNSLAGTYLNQGRWNEAEGLLVQALEVYVPAESPHTLLGMSNLAVAYVRQGRWDEAEAVQVQVADVMKQTLGERHPDTLMSMSNLAISYWRRGRYDKAEALQVQVVDARAHILGELHPDTLLSMSHLAATYSSQGRWDEAEALQVQTVDAMEQTIGERHPYTLATVQGLVGTYLGQGRWEVAGALLPHLIDAGKQVLGERHPDTLNSMNNLAAVYSGQGRWDEAETLLVQVVDASKQALGERHPDTLSSMSNLVATYSRQGRWDDAEALQVQVMDAMKETIGERHPYTLTCMNSLAETYSGQGRWDKAGVLLVRVVEGRGEVLGEDHPSTLASASKLVATCFKQVLLGEFEALMANESGSA